MHATEVGDTLLLHHFDDLDQQKNSSTLGMWAFLATEVMFFGGLFTAYALYRALYHEAFGAASRHLYVWVGFANTLVLLTSSLTMAMAVHSAATRRKVWVVRYLLMTFALGLAFLGVKAWEWKTDYDEHLAPGINFDWNYAQSHGGGHEASAGEASSGTEPGPGRESTETTLQPGDKMPATTEAGRAEMFFVLYFFMTGLHALHMVIGLALVGLFAYLAHRNWFSGGGETQIEMLGLYWHFVDIVWVFLYPLLYLIEVRP
ncbi:MAG TPA: cytochrome c oxidase subunit 3 [Isosphaeraceae bacterium]|jgi:cytochrome c oxidase subunit 3